jgi:transposase
VNLSEQERKELSALTRKGAHKTSEVINALILLNCDRSHNRSEPKTNSEIAQLVGVSERKIDRLKKRMVEEGLPGALQRKRPERSYPRKIDGALEARLIAMSCGEPPQGSARWSLRLLAERAVELSYADSLSHETVRKALQKTNSSPGARLAG